MDIREFLEKAQTAGMTELMVSPFKMPAAEVAAHIEEVKKLMDEYHPNAWKNELQGGH